MINTHRISRLTRLALRLIAELRKTFYHGSSDAVLNTDQFKLYPPEHTGKIQEKGRKKNLDRIFLTTDFGSAKVYAGRAVQRFGGNPVVYRVIPMEDLQKMHDMPGTSVYSASWAFYEPTNLLHAISKSASRIVMSRLTRLAKQIVAAKQGIVNLGFPEIISKIFYEKYGNLAPLIARWYKEYRARSSFGDNSDWWRMVTWNSSERMSLYAMTYMYENSKDPESYVQAAEKMGLDSRRDPEEMDQSMVDEQREAMIPYIREKFFDETFFTHYPLIKDITSGKLKDLAAYKKLKFQDAVRKYENKRHFEEMKPLKVYANGFKWIDVGSQSVLLAEQMNNCGSSGLMSSDNSATILALFGPTNKPHVMVTYSPSQNRISGDECSGSTEVKPEYHDYVLDIANHMGARFDESKSKSTGLRVKYLLKDKADDLKQIKFRDDDSFSHTEVFRFISGGQEFYTDGYWVVTGEDMKKAQELITQGKIEFAKQKAPVYENVFDQNNQRQFAGQGITFTSLYKFIGQWQ